MSTRHYVLGPVKPWVQSAADSIGSQFNVTTVYGFANRNIAGTDTLSDHALGLALDFMVYSDSAKGTAIANFCQDNALVLGVYYIMWDQHIWDSRRDPPGSFPDGWRTFADRGSPTANHMDHVHVSFNSDPPNQKDLQKWLDQQNPGVEGPFSKDGIPAIPGAIGDAGKAALDKLGLGGLADVLAWLGNGHNWYRILLVISGAILVGFGLIKLGKSSGTAGDAAAALGKVVK